MGLLQNVRWIDTVNPWTGFKLPQNTRELTLDHQDSHAVWAAAANGGMWLHGNESCRVTWTGSRELWGVNYPARRPVELQPCQTPRSKAWTRTWSFPWWRSPPLGSSTARGSVKRWSDSWALGPRPSTAPSGRSASCLPRKSANWAAGRRTIDSTSCMQKERRRPAWGRRTRVPPTSPPRPTHQHQIWTWAGPRGAPGCQKGVWGCTPVLLQRESPPWGRSSDGTCKKPAM